MSTLSLTVVCLPESTPADRLADTAASRLARASLAAVTTAAYFLTKGYFHRGSVLQAQGTTAAGGPITQLNLDAMRAGAHSAHWNLWQLWNQVVAGTRPALPYWTFLQHHRDDPEGYPLTVAQQQYLAQPRIAAMRTYNALPAKAAYLPTSHLEAFQINEMSYANFGLLHAVPGNSLLTMARALVLPRAVAFAAHRRLQKQKGWRVPTTPHPWDSWGCHAIAYCPDPQKHPAEPLLVVVGRVLDACAAGAVPGGRWLVCGDEDRRPGEACRNCGVLPGGRQNPV
jgi:hypothetical protein